MKVTKERLRKIIKEELTAIQEIDDGHHRGHPYRTGVDMDGPMTPAEKIAEKLGNVYADILGALPASEDVVAVNDDELLAMAMGTRDRLMEMAATSNLDEKQKE